MAAREYVVRSKDDFAIALKFILAYTGILKK